MSSTELGLAIFGAICDASRVLRSILDKINDVQDSRAQVRCKKIQDDAEMLQKLLRVQDMGSTSFGIVQEAASCIDDMNGYVEKMKDSSLLNDIMEVWWTKRYVEISNRVERLKERLALRSISQLGINSSTLLDFSSGPYPTLEILEADIHENFRNPATGFTAGGPYKDLIFYKLEHSSLSLKSLSLYPRLQQRAYVQQLRGIATRHGEYYIAMENCSHYQTLNAVNRDKHHSDALISRLEFAFKVAQTVALYHDSGMIIKAIYDTTVRIKKSENGISEPVLTGLENMRSLYERTTNLRFDCRYEAPEYDLMRQHTTYTDIWSLGIVLWQILSHQHPYGKEDSIDSDREEERKQILGAISAGNNPGVFSDELPQYLVHDLMNCWSRDPLMRPNALSLAKLLQEAWLRNLPSISHSTMPPPPPSLQDTAAQILIEQNTRVDTSTLQSAKQEASSLINQARKKKKSNSNSNDKTTSKKLPLQCVKNVIEGIRVCDAECLFIIGASVWWELLDAETYSLVVNLEVPSADLTIDANRARAELALLFLRKAEQGGYTGCHRELARAHRALSNFHHDLESLNN